MIQGLYSHLLTDCFSERTVRRNEAIPLSRTLDDGRKPEPQCPRVLIATSKWSYAKTDSFIVSFIYLLFFLASQSINTILTVLSVLNRENCPRSLHWPCTLGLYLDLGQYFPVQNVKTVSIVLVQSTLHSEYSKDISKCWAIISVPWTYKPILKYLLIGRTFFSILWKFELPRVSRKVHRN